jgi:hypothetical protein
MSRNNFLWGAPRIHGELLKVGFDVSQATVSRYMPRRGIRPPRHGAPSYGTRHLRLLRSVSAKQVGYQTSFLLSSEAGSRDLSGGSPRCGMPSLAGLSSHHRPRTESCRSACRSRSLHADPSLAHHLRRPQLDDGRSTTFTLSLEGITETEAAGSHKVCTTIAIARKAKRITTPTIRFVLYVCREQPAQITKYPQCPSPTWRRVCEPSKLRSSRAGPRNTASSHAVQVASSQCPC